MSNLAIEDLTALTVASTDDLLVVVDNPSGTPTTKKITRANWMGGTNIVQTVGTTETQTLTNKDLSSVTNTMPTSVVTLTGSQTLTNKTLTTPIISSISNTGTLTLPTSTDTLVGKATTDTLTNKTLTSPAINSATVIGGTIRSDIYAPQGYLINGKISATVSSNNLTVAIKTLAGSDASATDPIYIRIGNTVRSITAALSVTKNAGTTWFALGSSETATKDVDFFVYLGYNATDGVVVGFARFASAVTYADFSATTTNQKYAAISTITTASATDEYEVVGRFNATLGVAASYNWSISSALIINRPIYETRWLNWVPSFTGYSANPTGGTYKYKVSQNVVIITVSETGNGTSNSTTTNITLPFAASSGQDGWYSGILHATDNGAVSTTKDFALVSAASNILSFFKVSISNGWTGSGNKKILGVSTFFEI